MTAHQCSKKEGVLRSPAPRTAGMQCPGDTLLAESLSGAQALLTPTTILRLQRLAGNASVQAMLSEWQRHRSDGEDHVAVDLRPQRPSSIVGTMDRDPQPTAQRTALLSAAPGVPPHVMSASQRRGFVRRTFPARDRALATRILDDIARAADPFVFTDESELRSELVKRLTMSKLMRATQGSQHGMRAFGYPFTGASLYWGPRVNFAAKDYWSPLPPDGYSTRPDPVRRLEIRRLPRGDRHTVYGDPDDYEWHLTPAGAADPHEAILRLFDPQPPHRRSLLHCDYLISLVEYRAYAQSIGKPAFNAAVAAFGTANVVLRWNMFDDLRLPIPPSHGSPGTPGLGSLIEVRPTREADLVIGDHVVFWNHRAYDALNENIGNAWKLENAVLVDRRGTTDLFLGHGSGEKTSGQMRAKLAEEFNDVARIALALVSRIRHGRPADRVRARAELATRFPNVKPVGSPPGPVRYRIQGPAPLSGTVDDPLRQIRPREVLGLHDPNNPADFDVVLRPAESRP
jgi:hypothetical protein